MDGGAPKGLYLKKMVNGVESTIATYNGGYSTSNTWTTFKITYASGMITVTATKSGVTTTVFNRVADSTFTFGKIGAGGMDVGAYYDNVSVQ